MSGFAGARRLGAVAVAACALALPAAASAGTAYVEDLGWVENGFERHSALHFEGAADEANELVARADHGTVTIVDLGSDVTAGAHCSSLAANAVECRAVQPPPESSPLLYGIFVGDEIDLGRGADAFNDPLSKCTALACSPVSGQGFPLVIRGGEGNDRLWALAASPFEGAELHGGPGNDTLNSADSSGYEVVTCGPGFDVATVSSYDSVATDCEVVSAGP